MEVYEHNEKATCYTIPLSRKKLIKKAIEWLLKLIPLIIVISILVSMWTTLTFEEYSKTINSAIVTATLLTILSVIVVVVYNHIYIENYYYDIKDSDIIIRKGVFMKKELSLSYEKVQEVYIDQDLLDKLLGIYDVHLKTAAEHTEDFAHIDGLGGENAQKIKEMIIANIRKRNRSAN